MKILALAYACEPDKGSEQGAGWILTQMLAELGEVWVVTRSSNRSSIEEAVKDLPTTARIHFEYVELPESMRFWKKGTRGVRLYYLLWQIAALRRMRRLHRELKFDLIWHLTISNAWIGSVAAFVGTDFIYGPVGGGVRPPLRLVASLGFRGMVYELLRETARLGSRFLNPLARASWRRATLILAQNRETASWFPRRYRRRVKIFQHAVVAAPPYVYRQDTECTHTAVIAARFEPWKGISLAIRAVGETSQWRLLIYGSGSDQKRLERLVRKRQLSNRVHFRGQVLQEELFRVLAVEADAFLFPSLHDDASMAVAEASVGGLPVICLDIGGPPLVVQGTGMAVDATGSPSAVVRRLAKALQRVETTSASQKNPQNRLLLKNQVKVLKDILNEAPSR